MGNRINLGVGFGILLDEKEKKNVDPEDMGKKMKKFFTDKLKYASSQERFLDVFGIFTNPEGEKGKRYYVGGKWGSLDEIVSETFACPQKEHGPKSFLGYVLKSRYGDPIDYALLHSLGINEMVPFEVHVPLESRGDICNKLETLSGETVYIPSYNPLVHVEYEELVKSKKKSGKPIPFQSKEECERWTKLQWKELWVDTETTFYKRGLGIVQVFYPKTTMERVEKYVVGWWS